MVKSVKWTVWMLFLASAQLFAKSHALRTRAGGGGPEIFGGVPSRLGLETNRLKNSNNLLRKLYSDNTNSDYLRDSINTNTNSNSNSGSGSSGVVGFTDEVSVNVNSNSNRYNTNKPLDLHENIENSVLASSSSSSGKRYPPRMASVNSILRLDPSGTSLWDDHASVCRSVPGLTRDQMELCVKYPDAARVAVQGLKLATQECGFQMEKHRWNCSSLQSSPNPHNSHLLQKGFRESAFGHAIAAAGVAYSVAKACSQGKLLSCGCGLQYDDQVNYYPSKETDYPFDESNESVLKKQSITSWKWSGCSHNMNYGIRFAKTFLDSREKAHGLHSLINLHNNRAGRMTVSSNMEVRCKCHGLSGSCELRTCWRSSPDFRRVGNVLKNKFKRAIMIDQTQLGNRPLNRVQNLRKSQERRRRRDRRDDSIKKTNIDLWYYEKSPTFCESNLDIDVPGTSGRKCNRTLSRSDPGSCSTLCCGRGYNTIRQVFTKRCNCTFKWCCEVNCEICQHDEWITVCK